MDLLTTEAGVRLLFGDGPGIEGQLRRLAELERTCCAFANWSTHTRGEKVVLEVTAPTEECIAAIRVMFNNLRPAPPTTNK